MANVRLFLLLFGVTQTVFVLLDFWELWRQAGFPRFSRALRAHRPAIVSLTLIWGFYFAIQLSFSALLPSLQSFLKFFEHTLEVSALPMASPRYATLQTMAIGACTYYVAGFWDYLTHRFLLHSPYAWFHHQNHPMPKKVFNGMPGISARPFGAIASFLVNVFSAATMFLLFRLLHRPEWAGFFYRSLPAIIFAIALVGAASHSCFLRRFSAAHRLPKYLFITTPQEHLLHHSAVQTGNFGNYTTLWDRVFGTYLNPDLFIATDQLGLSYDQDFLGAVTAGRFKLPAKLREEWRLSEFCFLEQTGPCKKKAESKEVPEPQMPDSQFLPLRRGAQRKPTDLFKLSLSSWASITWFLVCWG